MADVREQQMYRAGVSPKAMTTTMKKEGWNEFRDWIQTVSWQNPDDTYRGVTFVASRSDDPMRVDLAFNLFAKEICLLGAQVLVPSLADMDEALTTYGYMEANIEWSGIDILFIHDFFVADMKCGLSDHRKMQLVNILMQRLREGKGVSVISEGPVLKAHWWPRRLLAALSKANREFRLEQAQCQTD